jgi:cation transport ATPase
MYTSLPSFVGLNKPYAMLIDNSDDSSLIRNVSYLMPIGICVSTIIFSTKNVLFDWLNEWCLFMKFDDYQGYWLSHLVVLMIALVSGYFFVRSLWRRIVSGRLNCARVFVMLFILAMGFIAISFLSSKIINTVTESRVYTSNEFLEYVRSLSPYVWGAEYVLIILAITFATRNTQKKKSPDFD